MVANTSNISNLWIASALLGFGHGSLSGLIPIVCLEWFGLREFFFVFNILYYLHTDLTAIKSTTVQLIFQKTMVI